MRLIDADALLRDIEKYHLSDGMFQHWVEVQTTIDAVPVIRCKECKYYEVGQNEVDAWSACYAHIGRIIETWDDNFCGWAERREE